MLIKRDINDFAMLGWLGRYLEGHKGFIAGGCFKDIFNGEKAKDIDVFFESEKDYREADAYFDRQTATYSGQGKLDTRYRLKYEGENAKAYEDIKRGIMVELCHKAYGSPEQMLGMFDFTVTKFACFAKDDGNYGILMDDRFFEHLCLKRLVADGQILYPAATFERMIRYGRYGYFPCRETKMKIIRELRGADESQVELSESLYEGLD